MTLALGTTAEVPPSTNTQGSSPRNFVNAGHSLPAAALTDPRVASWVRAHGVSVTARGDDDLDLIQFHGIRGVQVVYRCGPSTAALRRAVGLGVSRFVVSTGLQTARLAECACGTKYVYLDDDAPLVLGDRRVRVIGFHTDVDDFADADAWASAARRLVSRSAVLVACGSATRRITLSGGPTESWLSPRDPQARAIVDAVDHAVREACQHWRLARPAVTLAAATANAG